jgi:hypothetical protein
VVGQQQRFLGAEGVREEGRRPMATMAQLLCPQLELDDGVAGRMGQTAQLGRASVVGLGRKRKEENKLGCLGPYCFMGQLGTSENNGKGMGRLCHNEFLCCGH